MMVCFMFVGMRISFDIDDTLMMHGGGYPLEPNRVPWCLRFIFKERLRFGSCQLFRELLHLGHEISIYTTSSRKVWYIRMWFWFYGVKLETIVNQKVHRRVVRGLSGKRLPSKNPKRFGMDLHIDDLPGVALEGEAYGFDVLIIKPEDEGWTSKVLNHLYDCV